MSQKAMIALAASLTAFVLVLTGGVFARVSSADAAPAPVATISPAVGDLWNQREAAYRALIDQANQRLLETSPQNSSTSAASPQDQGFAASLSPAQAASVALNSVPGATLSRQPELVRYQGIVAYEVQTSKGPVYVDAGTGQILFSAAARRVVVAAPGDWEDHEGSDD